MPDNIVSQATFGTHIIGSPSLSFLDQDHIYLYSAYFSTMKAEAACSTKMSVM